MTGQFLRRKIACQLSDKSVPEVLDLIRRLLSAGSPFRTVLGSTHDTLRGCCNSAGIPATR